MEKQYDYDKLMSLIEQNADFTARTPNGSIVNVTSAIVGIVSNVKMRCIDDPECKPTIVG